ncbi:MAG: transposase [Candidatus Eremiobacteraeota bacterium]|nr:transposase [Candidatus Eremiobacteraeota bacterium]
MKKGRFSEAQIVAVLKELDAGTTATELGRRHGIHANTIRLWRDKYAGLETSDLARLKQLEDESRRKDRIIARLTMEVDAVRELISKNGWGSHSEKTR